MSDIVIRGMKMPECCYSCRASATDVCREWMKNKNLQVRSENCPLTELPPHGDLKDYNDILSIFDKVLHDTDDKTNALLCDILVQINYAPTKLEASKC